MAEKEERIRIEQFTPAEFGQCNGFTTDGNGYYCELAGESIPITKEICEKKCPYDSSISRQEAIEKMAKGLCAENLSHSCEDCMRNGTNDCFINEKEDFYKSLAEAALNALLEK